MKNNLNKVSATPKRAFFGGVLLLSASTLICKVIGLFFKIPMLEYVGIDGMAYFSAAYNVYLLLNGLSIAGLPVAISILVSQNRARGNEMGARQTFYIAVSLCFAIGLIGSAALWLGAERYSAAVGMSGAQYSVMAIAPTMFFICIIGSIRGYFQGYEMMEPTATSQLIESVGKLFLGVGFAAYAISAGKSTEEIAAAAVCGLSVGMLLSLLYLLLRLFFFTRKNAIDKHSLERGSGAAVLKKLLVIAFPITLAASVTGITSLTDTALITNRLIDAGYADSVARVMYSSYSNLAVPLFNMPPALLAPLSVSIVPTLTAAITSGDGIREKNVFDSSFRMCVFLALPAAAGMSFFAEPILKIVFSSQAQAVSIAAPLLSVLAISIIFSCLTALTNAVLQTYNRRTLPIVSMFIGAAVKMVTEYILVGRIGIMGAPVSTIACTLTVTLANIFFIGRYTPRRVDVSFLWRTFASCVLAISAAAGVYLATFRFGAVLSLFAAVFAAVIIYIPLGLMFRAVRYEDVLQLPKGGRIADILVKLKLTEVKNENTEGKNRISCKKG